MSALMETWRQIIENNAPMSRERILENEIKLWKMDEKRDWIVKGSDYYVGKHDIAEHKRFAIGKDGKRTTVSNLHNATHVDNQYSIALDKKVNYSFGQPFTLKSDNKNHVNLLKKYLNVDFQKTLRRVSYDAMGGGIGYLHPFYNSRGELRFRVLDNANIIPFWEDEDKEILQAFGRLYEIETYEVENRKIVEKFDFYTKEGIFKYTLKDGKLKFDELLNHFMVDNVPLNWLRVPLIAFRYNFLEVPLLKRVKSLQDGINLILSVFENNMMEDSRNTILIIHNYDGQDLGEFRQNLSTYGAVKVRSDGERRGGVDSLNIEVNSENYKSILALFKAALIENARSFDAKDERMTGDPNQMNIQSMLMDMDIDANGLEAEFLPAMRQVIWFVNQDIANRGKGVFIDDEVEVIFNRDNLISETEVINNIRASEGIISKKTQIEQHPWIDNVEAEMKRIKEEQEQEQADIFGGMFGGLNNEKSTSEEPNVLDEARGSIRDA